MPCEEKVSNLEAEIRGLIKVINDQHRYIQELHNSQAQQLQYIPNSHLGPENLHRGRDGFPFVFYLHFTAFGCPTYLMHKVRLKRQ